ncbi:hypothetical protein LAZ40_02270 [Cereibacter sphaeroides]|uniref:hypothetical protein n=1 Tax=Cereibacter sphaeroides TaxID=1063 RepID=UPI001F1B886F|nr:hypothetical protein [Cereibacter sphaeroides]MCE6957883.1 hypothetical protein [Cereibacter sphaeroides]MCE6971852.1 hypothetical protein [Cereibacter sphaeroides]
MKLVLPVLREAEVAILQADMEPRYWEDASVDGVDETDASPRMPLKQGELWKLVIDIATGRITDWPAGVTASNHYKVCDAGIYRLLDADGAVLAERAGYVPAMLGGGDYVKLEIDGDGRIRGWLPDFSCFLER